MNTLSLRALTGVCALLLFLSSPAPGSTAEEEKRGGGKEQEVVDTYVYTRKGKRDPFRSLLVGKKEEMAKRRAFRRRKAKKMLKAVPFTPLQQFDLANLKLTAIIWGEVGSYALIQAPDGKGYTVKNGVYMGKNHGIVDTITEDRIIITETFIDVDDEIKTRSRELKLRSEE